MSGDRRRRPGTGTSCPCSPHLISFSYRVRSSLHRWGLLHQVNVWKLKQLEFYWLIICNMSSESRHLETSLINLYYSKVCASSFFGLVFRRNSKWGQITGNESCGQWRLWQQLTASYIKFIFTETRSENKTRSTWIVVLELKWAALWTHERESTISWSKKSF